jgi:hypothetical protein
MVTKKKRFNINAIRSKTFYFALAGLVYLILKGFYPNLSEIEYNAYVTSVAGLLVGLGVFRTYE